MESREDDSPGRAPNPETGDSPRRNPGDGAVDPNSGTNTHTAAEIDLASLGVPRPDERPSTPTSNVDDVDDDRTRRYSVPGTPDSNMSRHSDRRSQIAAFVAGNPRRHVVPGTPGTPESRKSAGRRSAPGTPDTNSSFRVGAHGVVPATPATPTTPVSRGQPLGPLPNDDGPHGAAGRIPGTPQSTASRFSSRSNFSVLPPDHGDGALDGDIARAVIWGTSVSVDDVLSRFRRFIRNFVDADVSDDPFYIQKLDEIIITGSRNLNIDCAHLRAFGPTQRLYNQLLLYPKEIIPLIDLVVDEERQERRQTLSQLNPSVSAEDEGNSRIQVRTFNLHEHKKMRDLDPMDIDRLVSIRGMIIRNGAIIPDMQQVGVFVGGIRQQISLVQALDVCAQAFYQCTVCHNPEIVSVDRGRIDEPTHCAACNTKHSLTVIHNRCLFSDKQMIKLQETPESIPEGETPATTTLFAFDELVDVTKPGDKVEVTGIYRAVPQRVNSRRRTVHSVYRTYIDVLHFRKEESGRVSTAENGGVRSPDEFHVDFVEGNETREMISARKRRCEEMARDPNIYENLVSSLSPSIWEMEDVKKGILCQIVSGTNKVLPSGKFRGEINVLLCGDPGTSKSQLLGYVNKLVPRGIYTSGKGSSAVGLTAYVMKDPETKEIVLESGALVLSDRGICCIDEFDKMSDATRSVLHEVMEQQTISIAKAGIICTLNARTSVLASANPVESRYNPNLSVVQNLRLPPSLLSRFDLIYLILDKPDSNRDRRLAQHLVSLYYEDPSVGKDRVIYSKEDISMYLSHVKETISPKISDEAGQALAKGYLDMRQLGYIGSSKRIVTATPRQLESLIRLSEAIAKIRSSEVVTRDDVDEAVRLMHVATQKTATDPRTGRIDMDMITTGTSARERETIENLKQAVQEILELKKQSGGKSFSLHDIIGFLQEQSDVEVETSDLTEACRRLAFDNFATFNERSLRVTIV